MAKKEDTNQIGAISADDKEARAKALATALKQIEKDFGVGSVMRLGENTHMEVQAVHTGSLTLDLALGIGGLPKGRIVEIFGDIDEALFRIL